MSPLLLRRYRADRLLREHFEALRERVIATVGARLAGAGCSLDRSDLEAAYAQAWQGLHAAVLEGRQIVNPAGWLAVVTHRRALDERRAGGGARAVAMGSGIERAPAFGDERDLAEQLDDRARVRSLLHAMRSRLSERERQAAALCYLQGLSRAEAAELMGVSESRMRKLMDGGGRGLRGVAAKIGALAQAIAAGEWCEQQGSLMRGFAFGMLDPRGERYRLALLHGDECPACRSYVRSLRGLAAVLPPVPALLCRVLGAGAGAGAGAGVSTGSGHVGSAAGAAAGSSSASIGVGVSSGTISASGAGAAGGGWWLAGGVGAKLAAGCLVALGVGAGCVVLDQHAQGTRQAVHGHTHSERASSVGHAAGGFTASNAAAMLLADSARAGTTGEGSVQGRMRRPAEAAAASREFGLEQPSSRTQSPALAGAPASAEPARAASARRVASAPAAGSAGQQSAAPATSSSTPAPRTSAAEREFAPG